MAENKAPPGTVQDPNDPDYGRQPGQAALNMTAQQGSDAANDPNSGSSETRNKAIQAYHDAFGEYPTVKKPGPLPTKKPTFGYGR